MHQSLAELVDSCARWWLCGAGAYISGGKHEGTGGDPLEKTSTIQNASPINYHDNSERAGMRSALPRTLPFAAITECRINQVARSSAQHGVLVIHLCSRGSQCIEPDSSLPIVRGMPVKHLLLAISCSIFVANAIASVSDNPAVGQTTIDAVFAQFDKETSPAAPSASSGELGKLTLGRGADNAITGFVLETGWQGAG